VDTVLITDAIAVTVRLAALYLGLAPGLVPDLVTTALPRPASLRNSVHGQKNHGSGEKHAVFQ
jgi:hypothetical protein